MDKFLSIRQAARRLGIKLEVLEEQIESNRIKSDGKSISVEIFEKIKIQKEKYISLKLYLKRHDSDSFDSKKIKNRNKYLDYLEENDFFEVEHVHSSDILFSLPSENDWYIPIEDRIIKFSSGKNSKFKTLFS